MSLVILAVAPVLGIGLGVQSRVTDVFTRQASEASSRAVSSAEEVRSESVFVFGQPLRVAFVCYVALYLLLLLCRLSQACAPFDRSRQRRGTASLSLFFCLSLLFRTSLSFFY